MLSEHKTLLRIAETAATIGAVGSLLFAVRLSRSASSDLFELAFLAGFAMLMITFLPACALGGEYLRTVRRPKSYREKFAGLNGKEISALVRWAPNPHKYAAVLGVLIVVGTALGYGSVSWSSHHPPTQSDGVAGVLYLSAFFLFALPVLASAARMSGTYAESPADDA